MRVGYRWAAAALVLVAACSPSGRPTRSVPFVLVTIDTLPADRVGCYGCPTVRTPTLDRLARRGIQAIDAISPAPLTAASHTTILTGLDPPRHGVRENAMFRLADSVATVARLLPADVRKGAFVGAFPLASRFGLAPGFDRYDDDFSGHTDRRRPPERKAETVLAAAAKWLAEPNRGARPFVWVHLFDPHYPYESPAPWARVAASIPGGAAYEGEVAYTDRELGRFLDGLETGSPAASPTVLVVADHGESFGAHGEITHSLFVYDATQRVPMIFAGPDVPARLETAQRRLADVTPTILAAYEQPRPPALDGTPLREAPSESEAYVETEHTELMLGWAPLFGVRTTQWKYIRAPRSELYDLVADPAELHNLFAEKPEVVAKLSAYVDDVLASQSDVAPTPIDDETAERLRSLGYVATVSAPKKVEHGKDPKDGAAGCAALFWGEEAYSRSDFVAAQRYLLEAMRLDPTNKEACSFLAGTYHGLGRYEMAVDYARRSLELSPHINEAPVHATLGECLLLLGRPAEAIPHLEKAREHRAYDPKLDRLLSEARERLK
ncbi:MAG: sulfatase-like hydrolase/transferase [bacterium]